jgi:hypothetical protein
MINFFSSSPKINKASTTEPLSDYSKDYLAKKVKEIDEQTKREKLTKTIELRTSLEKYTNLDRKYMGLTSKD